MAIDAVAPFTAQEVMVAAAAREIGDRELVFVGMRLPLIAFAVAKATHAPNAIGLFENGVVRDTPAAELLYTMGDPPNLLEASWATRMSNVMALLQRGEVAMGFIGGAEVDRFGNVNTTLVGDPERPAVRLPGSGGAADIASLAQRLVVIMEHSPRRLPARVSFMTTPGWGDGAGWRQRQGLVRGGPAAVITTLGVLRFDERTREAYLASYHPGTTPEQVQAQTGWSLHVPPDVQETPSPTEQELTAIRRVDPQGFWTR